MGLSGLPVLPNLISSSNVFSGVLNPEKPNDKAPKEDSSAAGDIWDLITSPDRVVIIIIGLILIAAGIFSFNAVRDPIVKNVQEASREKKKAAKKSAGKKKP